VLTTCTRSPSRLFYSPATVPVQPGSCHGHGHLTTADMHYRHTLQACTHLLLKGYGSPFIIPVQARELSRLLSVGLHAKHASPTCTHSQSRSLDLPFIVPVHAKHVSHSSSLDSLNRSVATLALISYLIIADTYCRHALLTCTRLPSRSVNLPPIVLVQARELALSSSVNSHVKHALILPTRIRSPSRLLDSPFVVPLSYRDVKYSISLGSLNRSYQGTSHTECLTKAKASFEVANVENNIRDGTELFRENAQDTTQNGVEIKFRGVLFKYPGARFKILRGGFAIASHLPPLPEVTPELASHLPSTQTLPALRSAICA